MTQGIHFFDYEEDKKLEGISSLGGLPLYYDMMKASGLLKSVDKHVGIRTGDQGWLDFQMITAILSVSLAGGDSISDINVLESDDGLCKVMRKVEKQGLSRREARQLDKRFRRGRKRTFPSIGALFDYLNHFHDEEQDKHRGQGKAYVPFPNEYLSGLQRVNANLAAFAQKHNRCSRATLDLDATVQKTYKSDALYSYKSCKSYQPQNVWWAEQRMMLYSEFRDGNVPAREGYLRVLKDGLRHLPEGVKRVRLRSDSAGYNWDLMRYCEQGGNKAFGRIEFAISVKVSPAFKRAAQEVESEDWQPLYARTPEGDLIETGQEWAEVCYVPNELAKCKPSDEIRFLAIREPFLQPSLPLYQQSLPFQTLGFDKGQYKIFGVVTNVSWDGQQVIRWHRKRCGRSEHAHDELNNDFGARKLPSSKFGVNAAWWLFIIIAYNLNMLVKRLALGGSWLRRRMKAIRFHLINLPARVMKRSNKLLIRIGKACSNLRMIIAARRRIRQLVGLPAG